MKKLMWVDISFWLLFFLLLMVFIELTIIIDVIMKNSDEEYDLNDYMMVTVI